MIVSRPGLRFRRWMTGLLLAAYGSAGVLGYGLHAVWECEHHCHVHAHASGVAHSHSHDHGPGCHHHHHDHETVVADSGDIRTAIEPVIDDCPICEFLVQAQTPVVMEPTTACVGPALLILAPFSSAYVAPLPGVFSARGPPLS